MYVRIKDPTARYCSLSNPLVSNLHFNKIGGLLQKVYPPPDEEKRLIEFSEQNIQ